MLGSPDLDRLRVLNHGLGRFNASLAAVPLDGGRVICYGLVLEGTGGPGHCYTPLNPHAPEPLAGQHFAVTRHYKSNRYGHLGAEAGREETEFVQLFGVAFDDVVSLRANVAGHWHAIPLSNNGFFLEVRGVPADEVGVVEATLADGSTQIHDVCTGG